jgi:hypothetical protein
VRDELAPSWEEMDWCITIRWVSKHRLAARFPEKKDDILALQTKQEFEWHTRYGMRERQESDLVPLFTLRHKKVEHVPDGRLTEFLSPKLWLTDGPFPYRDLYVFPIVCDWIEGTPLGHSPMVDTLGPQDVVDAIDTSMITNALNRGVGNLLADDNADVSLEEMSSSMNLIKRRPGSKVEPLQWPNMPPEFRELKQEKIAAIETLAGINSVIRGAPSEAVGQDSSGAKLALIEAEAIRNNSGLETSRADLFRDVCLAIVHLYRDFGGNLPRLARIAGKNNTYLLKDFVAEDLEGIDRVKVDVGNPVMRTPTGKMAIADKAVELNIIRPGELQKYVDLLKNGTVEPLFEAEQALQMRIRGENEALIEGGTHRALISDPHWREIPEHLQLLDNPALREPTPENEQLRSVILAAVQDHINQFLQMPPWMVLMRGGAEALAMWQQVQSTMAPAPSATPAPAPGAPSGTKAPKSGAETATNPDASKPQSPGMPAMPRNPSASPPDAGAPLQ